MISFILAFAIFAIVSGLIIVIKPALIFDWLIRNQAEVWLYVAAIGVRAALGIALILVSEESRFPLLMQMLGAVTVLAALSFLVMGRSRFTVLMDRTFALVPKFGRLAGLVAILFGTFVGYAVV